MKQKQHSPGQLESLKAKFNKLDSNQDGKVTKEEARKVLETIYTKEDAEKLLKEIDQDGNGEISYREFTDNEDDFSEG